MTATKSRRETIKNQKRVCRKLDDTPIEIPASRKTIPNTKDMVRAYVQQALADSGATHGYASADEMLKEELDLDPEDPDPPWTSQYEVIEMEEVEAPHEMAPPQEGEQPPPVQEGQEVPHRDPGQEPG